VRKFTGANASTNIPIFSPTIAAPGGYAEGVTNVAKDTQARLSNKTLTPRAFISILPVSAETLELGSVNFEAELPSIFADAFAQGFHQQIATGSGSGLDFTGLFTAAAANGLAIEEDAGIMALRDLALKLQDYNDIGNACIIVHPSVYSKIMADPVADSEVDLYKEELIRSKRIEGVEVLLTGVAPSSVASGSVYAVGCSLQNYGLAVASEIRITPIRMVSDTNTYFEAVIFANGAPILDKEIFSLQAAASSSSSSS
jgi:hypothetical protein